MADNSPGSAGVLNFELLHAEVQIAADLFADGHLQEAVRKAAERFSNRVAEKAEREDLTGSALMHQVFSGGDHPDLVFSEERKTASEKSWHDGYRYLAAGLSTGVRNIYTHLDAVQVDEIEALEWLAFISAMHRRLDRAFQYAPPPSDPAAQADGSEPDSDT